MAKSVKALILSGMDANFQARHLQQAVGHQRHADKWGRKQKYAKLVGPEKKYGLRLAPATLIKTVAEEDKTFHQPLLSEAPDDQVFQPTRP